MSSEFHINGNMDKKLIKKLNGLGAKVAKKVVRGAATKSMTPMLKAARANAPTQKNQRRGETKGEAEIRNRDNIGAGALKKSLGKRTKTRPRAGLTMVWVGPRLNYKTQDANNRVKEPWRTAHLVEKGTAPHDIRSPWPDGVMKTIHHPGARANPFMAKSFFTTKGQTLTLLATLLAAGIKKQARSGAK